MNDVTTQCPACDAPVEIDLQDLTEGDCVVCDQCDEALTVVSVSPLELEIDEEAEDDDEDSYDIEDEDDFDDDETDYGDDDEDL